MILIVLVTFLGNLYQFVVISKYNSRAVCNNGDRMPVTKSKKIIIDIKTTFLMYNSIFSIPVSL